MQLVAYGAQDIYLTGNPQITFFKVVYRRHTNFSMESIQQTFNGTPGVGSRVTATISRNGDLVHKTYLQIGGYNVTNGSMAASVCNPGAATIAQVECEIGGQLIDRQYGHWMEAWAELTVPGLQDLHSGGYKQANASYLSGSGNAGTVAFDNPTVGRCQRAEKADGGGTGSGAILFGNNFQTTTGFGGVFNGSGISINSKGSGLVAPHGFTVPLFFWFCRNPGLALPLIALQYHEVKINLTFADSSVFSTSAAFPAMQLWCDYIYLDTDERRRFAQVSHEYLIEQIQFQEFHTSEATKKLNFNHPVKELIWTGQWTNASGMWADMSSNLIECKWLLKLNGHDRFAARSQHYFSHTQVEQHHSGDGAVDYAGDCTKENICVYSFALKPEEHQPSGTCNFSRIDSAQLQLTNGTLASSGINVYAVNYNVLRIMSGMGGLAYSN